MNATTETITRARSCLSVLALACVACAMESTEDAHSDPAAVAARTEAISDPEWGDRRSLAGTYGIWTYNEIAGTHCRDGSPAGVATNLSVRSKKLLIYLEGGSLCVDELSCLLSASRASDQINVLGLITGVAGMWDRLDLQNPLRDYNFVYVPYCSGDLHSGANPNAVVPNVGPQQFVGYLNMRKFLERIVPTFADATDVILAGGSAGGMGAMRLAPLVQRAFPDLKVKIFNDSGPPVSSALYASCLLRRERELFHVEQTYLKECGAACSNPDNAWWDYNLFVAEAFSDRPSGVAVAIEDAGIRGFLGTGNDECTDPAVTRSVPAAPFRADLLAFREQVRGLSNFGTFYPDNDLHTLTSGVGLPGFGNYRTARAGDVRLVDWLSRLVSGQSPGHAGP